MIGKFLMAVNAGDLDGLMSLLAEGVTWWSDGGGKVSAARRPLHGRDHVARFALALPRLAPEGIQVEVAPVNGQTAVIFRRADGTPYYVMTFEVGDGRIQAVRAIGNPDKLKRI